MGTLGKNTNLIFHTFTAYFSLIPLEIDRIKCTLKSGILSRICDTIKFNPKHYMVTQCQSHMLKFKPGGGPKAYELF